MSNKTNKIDQNYHENLRAAILVLLRAGSLLFASILAFYLFQFANQGLSNDQAVWGQFGDFFGGTLNPILSFLSFIALLFTILLQSRQLGISSKELELTREELKKAAEAQVLSEKALAAQARAADKSAKLETINALIKYYTELIERCERNYSKTNNSKFLDSIDKAKIKLINLYDMLDVEYKSIEQN